MNISYIVSAVYFVLCILRKLNKGTRVSAKERATMVLDVTRFLKVVFTAEIHMSNIPRVQSKAGSIGKYSQKQVAGSR